MDIRSRAWCFTINNDTYKDLDRLLDETFVYMIIGFEVGENGTPHIQGYIYFKNARAFHALRKSFKRAHLAPAKGSPEQNRAYCVKDEDFYEFGELPAQGRAKWALIEDTMHDPTSNPHLYQQYNKMYRQLTYCKSKTHERALYIVPTEQRLPLATSMRKAHKVTLDYDLDHYDDDEVIFTPCWCDEWVFDWHSGFPPRVKRGYEILTVDPRIVVIYFDGVLEFNTLQKKYKDIVELDAWQEESETNT